MNQQFMKIVLRGSAILMTLILLVLCSCKQDACRDTICLNGGVCVDGTCVCANGYTGPTCAIVPDLCAGVICDNGGDCVGGVCTCPQGWTGPNCDILLNPCAGIDCENGNCINGTCTCSEGWTGSDCSTIRYAKNMIITKVEIYDFPVTNNGAPWDANSGPDVYFALNEGDFGSSNYLLLTEVQNDVNVNNPGILVYTDNMPVILNDVNSRLFSIGIMEDDNSDDDIMFTSSRFTFAHPNYHLQNILEVKNQDYDIEVRLHVQWQY